MTDETILARVTGRTWRQDAENYLNGDEVEVAPEELENWPNRLARVEREPEPDSKPADEDSDGDDDGEDESPEIDPHPQDLTVTELRERVETVNDVSMLEAIRELEDDSDEPRTKALSAIDARIDELSE